MAGVDIGNILGRNQLDTFLHGRPARDVACWLNEHLHSPFETHFSLMSTSTSKDFCSLLLFVLGHRDQKTSQPPNPDSLSHFGYLEHTRADGNQHGPTSVS